MPISTFRCRHCRRGLMAADRPERAAWGCRVCGQRLWVPNRTIRWRDRVWRLWRDTGYPPWTRHVPDPEVRW